MAKEVGVQQMYGPWCILEALLQQGDRGRVMRRALIVRQLSKDSASPVLVRVGHDLGYRGTPGMPRDGHSDVLPACIWVKDTVAIYPAASNVLSLIKDDPGISFPDQAEVAQVRKEIGLHQAEFHGEKYTGCTPGAAWLLPEAEAEMDSPKRAPRHQRNPRLEALLGELSKVLAPGGDQLASQYAGPQEPLVLVTGTARSGSTLFLQWLTRSGAFGVPTNLLSRFWRAPAVGALFEQLLFDPSLDFRGELELRGFNEVSVPYQSDLGKTRGAQNVHEFWYFWRHFLRFGDSSGPDDERNSGADVAGFCSHLGALEAVLGRPLALKGMIASWELPWMARILPTSVFVDLVRDPLDTMASLLRAREEFYGDRNCWYSFQIPGRPDLLKLRPEEQVAAQVRLMRMAIEAGLASLPSNRVIRVQLSEFRSNPQAVWVRLVKAMRQHGHVLPPLHPDAIEFSSEDRTRKHGEVLITAWEQACSGAWDDA